MLSSYSLVHLLHSSIFEGEISQVQTRPPTDLAYSPQRIVEPPSQETSSLAFFLVVPVSTIIIGSVAHLLLISFIRNRKESFLPILGSFFIKSDMLIEVYFFP